MDSSQGKSQGGGILCIVLTVIKWLVGHDQTLLHMVTAQIKSQFLEWLKLKKNEQKNIVLRKHS